MDVEGDTALALNGTVWISPRQKRKPCAKVAVEAKRCGIDREDCKRLRSEAVKPGCDGSVAYQSFSPDVYEWLLKVSSGRDVCNFKRSGVPSRFMYYDEGLWKDFSKDAVATLCVNFRAGKSSVELTVDGKKYFISFLHMLQVNLLTCFLRSIAWIDEDRKCFFPSKCVEAHLHATPELQLRRSSTESCVTPFDSCHDGLLRICSDLPKSQIEISSVEAQLHATRDHQLRHSSTESCVTPFDSCHDGLHRIRPDLPKSEIEVSSVEATPDVTPDLRVGEEALGRNETPNVRVSQDFTLLGDKVIKLNEGDQEFTVVGKKFLAGLGMLATYTTITGIHRDSYISTSGQARLQAFKKQEEITRQARGDANVRYAWHGTSKQGVSGIVLHGFGQPRSPKNGTMYGVGVYLAPEDYSHVSAVYSDIDEKGEQHMVLCKAIMGSMEHVSPGSEQFHPSSEDYDTGVDDIKNPKRYIIWSTCMNTHILPQYIVSFKLAPQWHDVMAALRGKPVPGKSLHLARRHRLDGQNTAEQCIVVRVEDAVSAPPCKAEMGMLNPVGGQRRGSCSKTPRSPWMSFPMLFLVMKSKLLPAKMIALQQHYFDFKAGRMSRDLLIKNVRTIAGDRILADSIKSMQAQEKANSSFNKVDFCLNSGGNANSYLTRVDSCPKSGESQWKDLSTVPCTGNEGKLLSNEAQ